MLSLGNAVLSSGFERAVMVNPDHIVSLDYMPPSHGGEEYFDEDAGETRRKPARKARLEITLSSIELNWSVEGYRTEHYLSGSRSQTVLLTGTDAERVWRYFELEAEFPIAKMESHASGEQAF